MPLPITKHADKWGECIDRPDDDCVEIRWYDTTSGMDGDDFNQFLSDLRPPSKAAGDLAHWLTPFNSKWTCRKCRWAGATSTSSLATMQQV